ncbi:MAG TPA: hypothetical protein VIS99_17070 [Terrimicrobiaceae bacterium]
MSNSTEFLFASWRLDRIRLFVGWRGSIFTVITEASRTDRLDPNEKDVWQDITYTFDSSHPENGIKKEKGTPHK